MQLREKFSQIKVLVVGDVMLDQYWWGSVNRISPEAPVPVVRLDKTTHSAGGAANVAANIAGLGAIPVLVGIIGNDKEAELFPEVLSKTNVSSEHLVKIDSRPTTVKTRVVAHSQQIVRLDQESSAPLSADDERFVIEAVERLIGDSSIVILSDYAKGVISETVANKVIKLAKSRNIKILVDPKGKDYSKYRGATLLTPNKKEAAEACKLEENGQTLVETAGLQLMGDIETDAIIVTQGEDGLTVFENDQRPLHLNARTRDVYDVTGAGDTFIATLAVMLGAGETLANAADLANQAAGVVVEQIGTTAITIEGLQNALERNIS